MKNTVFSCVFLLFGLILLSVCLAPDCGGVLALPSVYISPNGNDQTGTGTSAQPYQTLSKALSVLDDDGTVWMETGVYTGESNLVNPSIPLTIRSVDPSQPAQIACSPSYTGSMELSYNFNAIGVVFSQCAQQLQIPVPGNYSFSNCTFSSIGTLDYCFTGGITTSSPNTFLYFENTVFWNNTLAIGLSGGSANFTNCVFNGNQVILGVEAGSYAELNGCTFTNNIGAITPDCAAPPVWGTVQSPLTNNGEMTIVNSLFQQNSSPGNGGAILNYAGALTIIDSQFASNNAKLGGGALYFSTESAMSAKGVTFTGNTAATGGALGCDNSGNLVYLAECTEDSNTPADTCPQNTN